MAERREAGGGADVPDGEGVNFPVPAENFVDKRERVCYDVMRVQETAPSCGEMSEWLKEPVLKTGGAQVPVGSNPTLSANFSKVNPDLRKYPSGRRGSPAKGVGWIKPARGFKSLLLRQAGASVISLAPAFFKCQSALIPPLLLSKLQPPCWVAVWFLGTTILKNLILPAYSRSEIPPADHFVGFAGNCSI